MGKKVAASIVDHFKVITDPRIDRNKLHNLTEIMVISICAAICGAEGFEDIEEFGKSSESWLRTFLELKFGIPSHDTFRRVFIGIDPENYTTEEQSHGRNEKRDDRLVTNMDWLTDKDDWTQLNSIGMVISTRTVDSKTTIEKRYYISSLTTGIKEFARGVRSHWGIENKLHWVLDVQMREDESRIRTGNAPENFAMLRHVALNLLRQEKTVTRGVKGKKLKAALDVKYREKVLFDN